MVGVISSHIAKKSTTIAGAMIALIIIAWSLLGEAPSTVGGERP